MRHRRTPPITDRSPLAVAVVASATVVVFFGLLVAASYPLVSAAAVGGAAVALAAPRAVAAVRARFDVDLPEPDADRPARGSRSRHS